MGWLTHVATGQRDDLTWHRGGEEHCLTHCRYERYQALHIRQEAHIEHLVSLVEDEGCHVLEIQVTLLGEIYQSTGGPDDYLDTTLEGFDLGLIGSTTIDAQDTHPAVASGLLQISCDLQRQLAGWHDDQRLWLALLCLGQL